MAVAKCANESCGKAINPQQDFRKVEGFERIHRSDGGTNALRLRKPTEVFMCRWCVEKAARGLSGQQALL